MKRGRIILVFIMALLLISLVSAGLIDSIKKAITGHATNQPTNVSVTVTGTTAVNLTVDNSTLTGGVNPTEGASTTSEVFVTVCDPDGVNDIDDSSVTGSFSKAGETTRTNSSCNLIGDLDAYCANFTCEVTTWYWDGAGEWTINVTASDLGNASTIYNDSFTFTMNQLKAMVIYPSQINWTAISPGTSDAKADNDPTIVNNTGNFDGTLNVTGLDLYGDTVTTEKFGVDNFTSGIADDCTGSGVYLANNSQVLITSSDSNPGNLSAGAGAGQEQLYYCIPTVPTISSQQYSTNILGSWIVSY
jgi:hypothetical protein